MEFFLIWGGLFILTVVTEICTQQLVSIWFAAGSLAAFLAVCFGGSLTVQLVLFAAVSVVLLIFTRPILRRILSFRIQNTNAQEVGRIATVIQPIDPVKNTGRVRLDGVDWNAVSTTGDPIPVDASVQVDSIDGSRLFVTPLSQSAEKTETAADMQAV